MTPDSIRSLATLVDVQLSPRAAVLAWPPEASPKDRAEVERAAGLVALGVRPDEACVCAFGADGSELGDLLARAEATGGRAGRSLLHLASRMEERDASFRSIEATGAGTKLSARIVVALPLLVGGISVVRSGPTAATLALFAAGLALIVAGARWTARLKPVAADDVCEHLALSLADAIEGGASIDAALGRLSLESGYADVLAGAREAVARGRLWPDGLACSGPETLRRIGRCCVSARRYGRPLAPVLRRLAESESKRRSAALDRELRRAPIRMVMPLTLCVLPGSLLIASAPLVT